jgi:hypothetical protein
LVSDFARVLGCEVALVGELDGDGGAQVVCASGIESDETISSLPTRRQRELTNPQAK